MPKYDNQFPHKVGSTKDKIDDIKTSKNSNNNEQINIKFKQGCHSKTISQKDYFRLLPSSKEPSFYNQVLSFLKAKSPKNRKPIINKKKSKMQYRNIKTSKKNLTNNLTLNIAKVHVQIEKQKSYMDSIRIKFNNMPKSPKVCKSFSMEDHDYLKFHLKQKFKKILRNCFDPIFNKLDQGIK